MFSIIKLNVELIGYVNYTSNIHSNFGGVMISSRLIMDAAIEVSHSHAGLYRLADTSSVFLENESVEVTKDVIKAFQIVPDTLAVVKEYHRTGTVQRPFTASVIFLRNLMVEVELLSRSSTGFVEDDELSRSINTVVSVLHIVAMGCFAYQALQEIQASTQIPRLTRLQIHEKKKAQLVVVMAISKIAKEAIDLLGSSYEGLLKVLTLMYNICAISSYMFASKAVRKHHKKLN